MHPVHSSPPPPLLPTLPCTPPRLLTATPAGLPQVTPVPTYPFLQYFSSISLSFASLFFRLCSCSRLTSGFSSATSAQPAPSPATHGAEEMAALGHPTRPVQGGATERREGGGQRRGSEGRGRRNGEVSGKQGGGSRQAQGREGRHPRDTKWESMRAS